MQRSPPLRVADAAYIAGLIDGEGTVTLTRLHRNEHRRLVVSISNTDRSLLGFVLRAFGMGRITSKRTYCERHAPSYAWQVSSRQALEVLLEVYPYLRTYKARRAALALERYVLVTPRNGRYGQALLSQRAEFEKEFLSILSA